MQYLLLFYCNSGCVHVHFIIKKNYAIYIYCPGLMWHWNDKFFDYAVCGNICRIRQLSAEVKLFVQYSDTSANEDNSFRDHIC